jgi:hypothetical protein
VRAEGAARASHIRHEAGTDTAHVRMHAEGMDERTGSERDSKRKGDALPPDVARAAGAGAAEADTAEAGAAGAGAGPEEGSSPHTWIALPVGRAETGPTISQLVEAVRAAGGMVGGEALFDPRYEPEMRRFLTRALEMEGIPLPKGGDTP